ncbi:hypothetical protein HPB49_008703 [Dermacentor silvarum]|uniref:Uncharacterized protein n=1 Tax=Dermacentor silvarum TaxID=543639 RepID=A0ACB8DCD0_DERSI|nr:hypothetical protein HPB49_008703 [Dermacentor silvarum]
MLLRQVKTWILRGWPNQLGPEQQCLQPYFTRRYELTVSKGLIYWGHRVVLPETERVPILRELHDTHPGMTAMKRLARTMFWYPGLDHDIEKLVQSCQQCVQLRTIKEGIKKNKDGSLLNRISKFLLRYRATPTRDGKSPAEMLLGFQPRTRLSAHFPEEEVARDPTVSRPPAPLSQVFSPGAPVWSRQYNHAGQRWLPGTVTSTRGRRMVTVDTTGGVQRRHVDQVRPRLAADDVKQEFDATRPGDNQVTESDQPSAVDDAEPSSDGSLGTPQISSEVTSSVPAGLELPRRSTRTRRPPDRLGF